MLVLYGESSAVIDNLVASLKNAKDACSTNQKRSNIFSIWDEDENMNQSILSNQRIAEFK